VALPKWDSFSQIHAGFDAMFSIAKIIEWLTIQERSTSQLRQNLPKMNYRAQKIRCSWGIKGFFNATSGESHHIIIWS
jgi:mannose-1-phosphate guanylyltransferase/phosphomannomutase